MRSITLDVGSAQDMVALGRRLAGGLGRVRLLYLRGPLGSGKTTLVRGILRGLGYDGAVKSPTFTLLESYALGRNVHHFDLYRLKDPEELEFLGIRDYMQGEDLCIVEWPQQGGKILPAPDLDIMIEITDMGRRVQFTAHRAGAEALLGSLA